MRIIKHFGIKSKRLYLGGFYIRINEHSVQFLGKEHAIGVMWPFQHITEGVQPRGIHWRRTIKQEML